MEIDFTKVAPYLKDPLVLVGFFLFISFLFARYLVKQRVIPPLPASLGFKVLKTILLYGFVIGLVLICLGFGLKYKELKDRAHQAEEELRSKERQAEIDRQIQERLRTEQKDELRKQQEKLISLLDEEMVSNLRVAGELQKNAATLLNAFAAISTVLRNPGIKLLYTMFPKENIDPAYDDTAAANLADEAFNRLVATNLYQNELEKEKLTAAAHAITAHIDATSPTVSSLSDSDHHRYHFSSDVWRANLPTLKTVLISDLRPYQQSYSDLNRLRDDYDVVTSRFQDYLKAIRQFFDPEKHLINKDGLRAVLAQERLALSLITQFGNALVHDSREIRQLQAKLHESSQQQVRVAAENGGRTGARDKKP